MGKSELKKLMLNNGMEAVLNKLYKTLNPKSGYYNSIIQLNLRFKLIENDFNKNIVPREERNVEIARIQITLLEYIDDLTDEDLLTTSDSGNAGAILTENKFFHFWKSFFDIKTSIVIGTYYSDKFKAWEASTLMATGDALALGKVLATLNKFGVKNIDVIPTFNFSGDKYQDNLILLGGPDANQITRRVYEKLSTKFKFGNPDKNEISLYDSEINISYSSKYDSSRQVIGDYGIVFKTKNPFNPEATVIILAGCFGFGTCAAAQLFEMDSYLQKMEEFQGEFGFEALVYSDIINDWTQRPNLVQSYVLGS